MTLLYAGALELQKFCEQRGWRFCFIGGLAVQRWGNPRVTEDADMTLLAGFGREEEYVDGLLSAFEGRIAGARKFAIERRVLLLRNASGIMFDVALGAFPFEEACVARSSPWEIAPGEYLRTCSAEDLLVFKAFASRTQDWADIENVLMRQGPKLDGGLVVRELTPLAELKEEPGLVKQIRHMFKRFGVREGRPKGKRASDSR